MHSWPLRSLELKNFKSIASSTVEFNPLTVLVGMNSSGKSSLLQGIRFLSQTAQAHKPGTEVPLNGTQVRLGTFDDARTSGRDGPMSLKAKLVSAEQGSRVDADGLAQALTLEVEEPASRPERGHVRVAVNRIEVPNATTLFLAEQWLRAIWREYVEGYRERQIDELRENDPSSFHELGLTIFSEADLEDLLDQLKDMCGDERAYNLKDRSFVGPGIRDIQGALASIGKPRFEEYLAGELQAAEEIDESDPRRHDMILRLIGIDHPDDDFRKLARQIEEELREELSEDMDPFEQVESNEDIEDETDGSPFSLLVDLARRAFYRVQEAERESETSPQGQKFTLDTTHFKHVVDQVCERAHWRHTSEEGYALALSIAEAGGLRIESGELSSWLDVDLATDFLKVSRMFVEECRDEPWADDPVFDQYANRAMERGWRPAVTALLQDRVRYLGPLRQEPRAYFDYDDATRPDVGAAGEHLASVLQWHRAKLVDVPGLGQADLVDGLQHCLRQLGIEADLTVEARGRAGVSLEVRPAELDRPVDLMSVGVGISQVLPVLAVCLLAEPGDIVLLEQPELHLHPALQMRLADFLVACVESGRQIIVETHSEHLVNRLRRRVAEDDGDSVRKLIQVVFAERDDAGHTSFRASDINPLGGLSEDWPDGFLDLGARDAQKLLQAGLAKHRRLSNN